MTLTKEWLQKAISDIETMRDEIPFGLDEDGNNTLAALKLALAGMEAEPVAYMIGGHYLMHAQDPKVDNYSSAVPLYTAPQPLTTSERAELENYRNAQQVVPGLLEPVAFRFWPDGDESSGFIVDSSEDPAHKSGDSDAAGRKWVSAPLYASPQSGAVKDGWVACSERLPDETNDPDGGATCYLVLYAEGRQPNGGSNVQVSNVTYLRRWHDGMITHWMPLPAAPQQEAVLSALEHGMYRYSGAMQKLADGGD